jgi:hypothetical protein
MVLIHTVSLRHEKKASKTMSTPATNNPSTRQISAGFQNNASNIGNQAGHQTINGGQHNHL